MTISTKLLDWYETNQRVMPWRAVKSEVPNPYYVWLSEVMLQQTQVVTVIPYFESFIKQWPTIMDLAKADIDQVLHSWQGLGYYSRARNLHKCALFVAEKYNGIFPQDLKALKALPGVGDYTAAAILSIAFNHSATVVDGNVERVISRIYAIEIPLPESKKIIKEYAIKHTPKLRPGDYAQAIMDLGATICTPTNPKCLLCPLKEGCTALKSGEPEKYPVRLPKKKKPHKYGIAFWIERQEDAAILLRKRPDSGLLPGMIEVPSSSWVVEKYPLSRVKIQAPLPSEFIQAHQAIKHTFTHFSLELEIYKAIVPVDSKIPQDCFWCLQNDFASYAIPTVMKKVINAVLVK